VAHVVDLVVQLGGLLVELLVERGGLVDLRLGWRL
jgi:hypothetical protein